MQSPYAPGPVAPADVRGRNGDTQRYLCWDVPAVLLFSAWRSGPSAPLFAPGVQPPAYSVPADPAHVSSASLAVRNTADDLPAYPSIAELSSADRIPLLAPRPPAY